MITNITQAAKDNAEHADVSLITCVTSKNSATRKVQGQSQPVQFQQTDGLLWIPKSLKKINKASHTTERTQKKYQIKVPV